MHSDFGRRPKLPERHTHLIDLTSLNELILIMEVAYNETRNEKVFRALKKLESIKQESTNEFWRLEDLYRNDEIREFWENPGAYPHSVRVWMMYYRDEENA